MNTRRSGAVIESYVEEYLSRQGFKIITKNFTWKGGEIDLVLLDPRGILVFIEVRSASQKSPWLRYSIHTEKLERIYKSIQLYLSKNKWATHLEKRFDVVWVENRRIEHRKNISLF